jgi:phage protein D
LSDDLRNFLNELNNRGLPDGWQETTLGRKAHAIGFEEGYTQAVSEYEPTLDAIRQILDLERQRSIT